MKKSCLFSTTFFALTILASCGGADVAPAALVNAVKSLEGDFKTELVITSGRQYLNPWYSSNDFVNSIQVSQEYKLSEDKTYMHSKIYAYRDNLGTNIELLNSIGEYEVKTGLLVEETLNHKNEKVVTRLINASNSDFIHVSATALENMYASLELADFSVDATDSTLVKYDGELAGEMAQFFASFYGELTSATFKLEGEKFTSFTFEFEPTESTFSSTNFSGSDFLETLKIEGEISYSDLTLGDLKSIEGTKLAALDDALAPYKNTDKFSIKTINPDLLEDREEVGVIGEQIVYDGDRIAVDLFNLFSDNLELNTLSYFDGKFVLDEESGKYRIDNLSLNEETYEFYWMSSKEVVESAGEIQANERGLLFEKDAFKLDFANIDSSLFTLREGTTDTFDLNPAAAKTFGKCIVPVINDYSAAMMATEMHLDILTDHGSAWSIKLLENNELYFEVKASLDFNGSESHYNWGFILGDAGTASCDPFYAEDLPVLE